MFNKNSGYSGYSMSNRAVAAYANGEKPYSKWKKGDVLEVLGDALPASVYDAVSKFSCEVLKKVFLYRSSWHHTSNYCNDTDFYSIDDDILEKEGDAIIELLRNCDAIMKEEKEEAKKEEVKIEYVRFSYVEWIGTRKHPKALHREAVGIVKNDWIICDGFKKKASGNHIKVINKRSDLKGNTFTKEEKEQLKAIKKELKK